MEFLSTLIPGEYLYSIAAVLSFSAYLMGNVLWLRILLVMASSVYVIAGISLGITSMAGWNSAYLLINSFHVVILLLNNSTVILSDDTKEIYHQEFSSLTTREFKKLILMNPLYKVVNEQIIDEGETPGKMLVLIKGEARVIKSGKQIAIVQQGDLVGEMSFMSNQPASADVVTIGEATIAYWTHQDLDKINKKNYALYNKFISIIGRNLVKKINRKNNEIVENESQR